MERPRNMADWAQRATRAGRSATARTEPARFAVPRSCATRNAWHRTVQVRGASNTRWKQNRRSQINKKRPAPDTDLENQNGAKSGKRTIISCDRSFAHSPADRPSIIPRKHEFLGVDSDYVGGIPFVLHSPELSPEERKDDEMSRGIYGHLWGLDRTTDVPWSRELEFEFFVEWCNGELACDWQQERFRSQCHRQCPRARRSACQG
jgi:hypothetical protein